MFNLKKYVMKNFATNTEYDEMFFDVASSGMDKIPSYILKDMQEENFIRNEDLDIDRYINENSSEDVIDKETFDDAPAHIVVSLKKMIKQGDDCAVFDIIDRFGCFSTVAKCIIKSKITKYVEYLWANCHFGCTAQRDIASLDEKNSMLKLLDYDKLSSPAQRIIAKCGDSECIFKLLKREDLCYEAQKVIADSRNDAYIKELLRRDDVASWVLYCIADYGKDEYIETILKKKNVEWFVLFHIRKKSHKYSEAIRKMLWS